MGHKRLQTQLLKWFAENKREMPWRGELAPYKIWISEVMLQQTQVVTVIPYYHRFLEKFPTVQSLAAASLGEVLKMWEGLGYYARARNLHKAAQKIVAEHQGILPKSFAQLKTLPGFGEYTAGAVASIAFGENVPAVDGNVKRVLSRIFAIESDITRGDGRKQLHAIAETLAQETIEPANWTETLIELGATVCLPKNPKCETCPISDGFCAAQSRGIQSKLPVKPPRKTIPHYDVSAGVIFKDATRREFLIAQRPLDGMLGGLWEFPGGKQETGETLQACLRREIQEELGIDILVAEAVTIVKHAFTHFKITLHAFAATLKNGTPQKIDVENWAWVTLEDLDDYAFAHADKEIIAALRQQPHTQYAKD